MPGWHAKTEQLVADKNLLVAGIAPEQHGDRMALFLQWKQMEDMPVMVDSFNLLNLKVVPVTLLIDESGVIRHRNPSQNDLTAFMSLPAVEIGSSSKAPRLSHSLPGTDPVHDRAFILKFEDRVIDLTDPRQPDWLVAEHNFQIGVAYRKRYDSRARMENDFANAVKHWSAALELDPTNYIWRRRLQQYGPLLDKPYPFYDWVTQARNDITARGDTPHPLVVEPGEAERARPGERPGAADNPPAHPDPDGKLPRDHRTLVLVTSTVVPHTRKAGQAVRVFLEARPNHANHAKWNDEAGISSVHIKPPEGWTAHPAVLPLPPANGKPLTSSRIIEFELHHDGTTETEQATVTAECFYHACSGTEGPCEFLRQDVEVKLPK